MTDDDLSALFLEWSIRASAVVFLCTLTFEWGYRIGTGHWWPEWVFG